MVDHQVFDKNDLHAKKESHETEAPQTEAPTLANQVLGLQNTLGNQGVQRMLSGTGTARPSTFIQAKMTVGAADDAYEKEADAVAHEVVHRQIQREEMPEEEIQAKRIQREEMDEEALQAKRIQREEMEEEPIQAKRIQREEMDEEALQAKRIQREEMEEEPIQAKRIQREEMEEESLQAKRIQRAPKDMSGSFDVSEDIESSIQSKKGGGSPLPDDTRASMESGFGQDFSNVKVHTDSGANELNHAVQAKAFTTGSDIFFREGSYDPGSTSGKELIAHELTHVVQQGGSIAKKDAEEGQ